MWAPCISCIEDTDECQKRVVDVGALPQLLSFGVGARCGWAMSQLDQSISSQLLEGLESVLEPGPAASQNLENCMRAGRCGMNIPRVLYVAEVTTLSSIFSMLGLGWLVESPGTTIPLSGYLHNCLWGE